MTANTREFHDDSHSFLRCFGLQLKLFRERAGLSREELGDRLGYSAELIASIEQGRRVAQPEFIDRVDPEVNAGGVLIAARGEVARARYPAFFRDFAKLEADALGLGVYASLMVPGLLQTEDYARATFAQRRPRIGADTVEFRTRSRMSRQKIFDRSPAAELSFVMDEAILHRPIGDSAVLRGQLEHLLLVMGNGKAEVQVMPLDRRENPGVDGAFTVVQPKIGDQVVYVEAQGRSIYLTTRAETRSMAARYGSIRAQAMTPRESSAFIETRLRTL
ncbi:hypothetical protein SRB5_28460 [Streptomyces sp. RB5]|uniref:HTH cro/C1-type domain-containing protein n=1 Tax=Streptomyces smaragdinus TaxID=2585196 RepID=A0A7K0CGV4_9ACTN|nr:helix-turn-helix transcriptional regulator [Streptomyces smaragdinus]MQY12707.1 hypothetical protein [Streptomyces smaragdinus]